MYSLCQSSLLTPERSLPGLGIIHVTHIPGLLNEIEIYRGLLGRVEMNSTWSIFHFFFYSVLLSFPKVPLGVPLGTVLLIPRAQSEQQQ